MNTQLLTLYHGTDARLLSMSKEERAAFFSDVDLALDYLWTIWKPLCEKTMPRELYYSNGQFKGTIPRSLSFLESKKQQFLDAGEDVLYYNLHEKVNMWSWTEQGAELYQYGALYLTFSKDTARNYARQSFAGGERGLIVYRMLEGIDFLGISLGNPDEKISHAIQKVQSFGEPDRKEPIIVTMNDIDPGLLLSEKGEPVNELLKLTHNSSIMAGFSFRYMKDVDLSLYSFERV